MRAVTVLLSLFIITGEAALAQQQPGSVFPTLQADNLNGREMALPQDLPGDPTIVLVAFTQEAQATVNAWVRALESFSHRVDRRGLKYLPSRDQRG